MAVVADPPAAVCRASRPPPPQSIAERRLLRRESSKYSPDQHPLAGNMPPPPIIIATHTGCQVSLEQPDSLPVGCELVSRWSPDTSYADTSCPSQDSVHYSQSSGSSMATTDDFAFSSSIDIVQAQRHTVKRAQPQMVRWHPPFLNLTDQDGEGHVECEELMTLYDDGGGESADDESETSVSSEVLTSELQIGTALDDAAQQGNGQWKYRTTTAMDDRASKKGTKFRADLDSCVASPVGSDHSSSAVHYYVEFDETGMQRSMHAEVEEVFESTTPPPTELTGDSGVLGARGADPSAMASLPTTGNKTSFFHHSHLRRHNSTDNYARTQSLASRHLQSRASNYTRRPPVRPATEARPTVTAGTALPSPLRTPTSNGLDLFQIHDRLLQASSHRKSLRLLPHGHVGHPRIAKPLSPTRRADKGGDKTFVPTHLPLHPPPPPPLPSPTTTISSPRSLIFAEGSLPSSPRRDAVFGMDTASRSAFDYTGVVLGGLGTIPYANAFDARAAVPGKSTARAQRSLPGKLFSGIKRGR